MAGIVAAERSAKDDAPPADLDEETDAARMLQDPASLDIFVTWYTLGGYRNPPTPAEIAAWPAAWLHDWPFLFRRLQLARHRETERDALRSKMARALKGK